MNILSAIIFNSLLYLAIPLYCMDNIKSMPDEDTLKELLCCKGFKKLEENTNLAHTLAQLKSPTYQKVAATITMAMIYYHNALKSQNKYSGTGTNHIKIMSDEENLKLLQCVFSIFNGGPEALERLSYTKDSLKNLREMCDNLQPPANEDKKKS